MSEHEPKNPLERLLSFSRNPWICVGSAALGVFMGLCFGRFAEMLSPVGEIYMTLLTLTVTPIIFCALASGICKLFLSNDGRRYAGRIITTLVLGSLTVGFLGVFMGIVAMPFLNKFQDMEFVGQMLSKFEEADTKGVSDTVPGVWGFIHNLVPSNMVDALASENLLAVVFLATVMGLAICRVPERNRLIATGFIEAIYDTFLTVLEWVLYLLPIGLFCIMASQAEKVGAAALKAMLSIIAVYFACFLMMTAFYLAALRRTTGRSLKEIWIILKEPWILAFVASADSALPLTMERMAKFGYPKEMLSSAIPLSAAMNRHGTVIIFALTSLFIANIYDVELSVLQYLFLALGCAVVGSFDSGEYVTIAPMLAYILIPLGLPAAAGVAIILTIWPMIEWIPELQCIMAASANAAIAGNMANRSTKEATQQRESSI
jgi:proton glutamate symport protein